MDYQLQQTGLEVQNILNQAPGVVSQEALNTIDAVGVFYVKNEEDDVSGLFFCYEEKDDYDQSYYTQVLLINGKTFMRAGQLPLTDQWIDYNQMAIDGKVDKRTGYGLSKNDFSDYYKGTIESLMRDVERLTDGKLGREFVAELPAISYNTLNKVYFIQSTVDANCVDAYIVDTSVSPNAWKQIGKSIDTSVFYQKPAAGIPKTDLAAPVQTSLEKADTSVQPAALTPIQIALSAIESLIPGTASAQNQLADKNYVDTHSAGIDVDDELSTTSENPVQNKVVTTALNDKQATIYDLSTIRSGASAGATAVQPAAMNTALAEKQDTISDLSTIRSGASAGATAVQPSTLQSELASKQDVITDLSTIRSGAAAGATAYQKPSGGIPSTDMTSAVQTDLGKAETAYQKPSGGIPASDLANGVIPTVPVISTNIVADANSDTKTASPKAVKTYVDGQVNGVYVVAWDGESTPVAANIPSGVVVTYNTQTYTGSLAASASTTGKIYLVGDGEGNFDRYITELNGSTYLWYNLGTTAINLADYATKEEVAALEYKIDGVNIDPALTWTGSKLIKDTGAITNAGSAFSISDFVEVREGVPITVYGVHGYAGVDAPSVHFYNASQVHIGYLYAEGTTDITANISALHASYIRISQYDDGTHPTSGVAVKGYIEGCAKKSDLDVINSEFDTINNGYRGITSGDFVESVSGIFTLENGDIYVYRAANSPEYMMLFKEGINAVEFTIESLWDNNLISLCFGVGEDAGSNNKACYANCYMPTSSRPADIGAIQNTDYDGAASNAQAASVYGQGHFSGDYRQPQVVPASVSVGDRCRIELVDGHFFRGSKYNTTSKMWDWWFCLDANGDWFIPTRYGWSTRKAIGFAIRYATFTTKKKILGNVKIITETGKLSYTDFVLSQNFPTKKGWVAIGDSITEINDNNGLSYVGFASRSLNWPCNNQGQGGWSIYKLWRDRTTAGWEDAVSALKDGDVVTLLAGTNDFDTANFSTPASDQAMDEMGNPHPRFGTTDPTSEDAKDPHTTLGCLRLIIERILTLKPGVRLYIFSPFYREKGSPVGTTSWTTLLINSDGKTIYDYADAIYDVGREYNLPSFNTCRDCGINKITLATYTYDDLHIGQLGGELIGEYVAKRIKP